MYIVICYAAYLCVSVAVTIWVAGALQRNGRAFLIDAFHGDQGMADSVNRLLVVGFYLINIGYVTLALRYSGEVTAPRELIELFSDKIGLVLVVLGAMHFLNLYVFSQFRRRGRAELRPPIPADARIAPPREA